MTTRYTLSGPRDANMRVTVDLEWVSDGAVRIDGGKLQFPHSLKPGEDLLRDSCAIPGVVDQAQQIH
jgi:hypothetical protein